MLGSEFWSSMPERSHVSISVLFRKQEPKRFIGSLRGDVPLKRRLTKPPDLLGSVLPKCAHSLRTQDQGDGSAFQFSSVFEPFEFLDVSFCALWTFFRCLFMFLLGPKFFLHWDIQHLRGLVCASSSAGDLWKNDDFLCMFQSYISTDQAAVCVLLTCDCWGRV